MDVFLVRHTVSRFQKSSSGEGMVARLLASTRRIEGEHRGSGKRNDRRHVNLLGILGRDSWPGIGSGGSLCSVRHSVLSVSGRCHGHAKDRCHRMPTPCVVELAPCVMED